jgi:hypothetical protein
MIIEPFWAAFCFASCAFFGASLGMCFQLWWLSKNGFLK